MAIGKNRVTSNAGDVLDPELVLGRDSLREEPAGKLAIPADGVWRDARSTASQSRYSAERVERRAVASWGPGRPRPHSASSPAPASRPPRAIARGDRHDRRGTL